MDDYFTVKLIDFDASFLQDEPPRPSSLGFDPVYMAPESFIYANEFEDDVKLTPKADVFSLGILFHEILSGELPKILQPYPCTDDNYCTYIFEAMFDDVVELQLNVNILPIYQQLIEKMLKKDVKERFSINQVMDALYKIKNKSTPKDIFDEPIIKNKKYKEKDVDNKDSELKGTMAGGKVVTGTGWSTLNDSDLG
ncbi:MAG: protein kinase [Ruminococcus sp.]|nr:protein kinase [Ruminococcus sp.]